MAKPITKKIQRRYPGALDITDVHLTREDAEYYALNNPTAYPGQIITFTENDIERAAIVQADKTILEIPTELSCLEIDTTHLATRRWVNTRINASMKEVIELLSEMNLLLEKV